MNCCNRAVEIKEEKEKEKEKKPALQDVGGSFWRSLSSFKIRFEAITKIQKSGSSEDRLELRIRKEWMNE